MIIGIDADHFDLARTGRGHIIQHGIQDVTRLTPRRRELHQNRLRRLEHFGLEVGRRNAGNPDLILFRVHILDCVIVSF